MKKIKGRTILAFLAAVCFLIVFLVNRESINFILACAWFCIGAALQEESSKEEKNLTS